MTRSLPLWAQVDPMALGRNFRAAEEQFSWANVVLVAAVAAAVAFAIWLGVRYATDDERRGYRSPRRLFRELCRAHQLDRRNRVMLARLASAHRIAPALLFVTPERFDANQLDASWTKQRTELEHLRDTIFGRKLPDATA